MTGVIRVRCRLCSKFRDPREFIGGSHVVGFCWDCYAWHMKAIEVLATGKLPRGCQICERTYEELERLSPNGDVPMTIQKRDGIYVLHCRDCGPEYERKRLDMYRGTPHGERLIRGA